MSQFNSFGQPVGPDIPDWVTPPFPQPVTLTGRFCRIEPLSVERHSADLFAAHQRGGDDGWTYLPYGPFATLDGYRDWVHEFCFNGDMLFFAIIDLASGSAVGQCSYLRINPEMGSIEVGHIKYGPQLARTPAATEAMYLLMQHAFDLGYRRYEWKCDALNAPSQSAARRLGFRPEGVHREAVIYRNRLRDTAWFSIIKSEWPVIRAGTEAWLGPGNFDENGQQRLSLAACINSQRPSR